MTSKNDDNQLQFQVMWNEEVHPLKYYHNKNVKIFEDESHEFKMVNIKDEEAVENFLHLVAKYICAFLNSNSGCLYIGINDDGIVKGLLLNPSLFVSIKQELNVLISLFHPQILDNLIHYKFFNVYNSENKIIEDTYVLEIFTRKGKPNEIYTTPFKDSSSKDYECFIKLNGTTHKIGGNQLQKYIKSKIKNYYLEMKRSKEVDNTNEKNKEMSIFDF